MKTHELDLVSLVFGLLFITVGGLAVAGQIGLRAVDLGWVAPAVALVLGIVLLATIRPAAGPDGHADPSVTSGSSIREVDVTEAEEPGEA